MATEVQQCIETRRFSPEEIAAKTREIYHAMLRESEHLDRGNFTRIHPDDVQRLFDLYDRSFFGGGIRKLLGLVKLNERVQSGTGKPMDLEGGIATGVFYLILVLAFIAFFENLNLRLVVDPLRSMVDQILAFAPSLMALRVTVRTAMATARLNRKEEM